MLYGLTENTIVKICDVFKKYPQIEKVILYGSRAKGNYTNGSDIDFTIIGKNINLQIINKLENNIDDLLLPYSFDISIFNQIKNEKLLEHINRVGKIFYTK